MRFGKYKMKSVPVRWRSISTWFEKRTMEQACCTCILSGAPHHRMM